MRHVEGKSSRRLLREYSHLNKECWGRHLWARGFFVASSGNVTDEVIMEYILTQELRKDDAAAGRPPGSPACRAWRRSTRRR
jgi:putative transposase